MYADFFNQIYHIGHYAFSFALLFLLWPRFLFSRECVSFTDNLVSGFLKMVLSLIILGYILVPTALFEVLSIVAILLLLSFRKFLRQKKASSASEIVDAANILLFDITDGIVHPLRSITEKWERIKSNIKTFSANYLLNLNALTDFLLYLMVFSYSACLRFYDAVKHAAPALSDAYTTLAWMKHIDSRVLFYSDGGGVYPRGFHIILATINKFAAIDPLYVLRYTGPLVGLLITFGLYFAVSRISGRTFPGIVSAIVFGVFCMYLPIDWERQASTNSQEFAFVFIMPSLAFFYLYLRNSRIGDLKAGAAGITIIGLVHHLALVYAAIGLGVLLFTAFITNIRENFKKMLHISAAGLAAAVISLTPFGLGKLMGIESHSSSVEYLLESLDIPLPKLDSMTYLDKTGLICLLVLLVYLILFSRKFKESLAVKFTVFFGLASFIFYFYSPAVTNSVMLQSRSREFWALVLPVCIGMGWHGLTRILPFINPKNLTEKIILPALLIFALFQLKPVPAAPYKLHSDAYIEQYLKISTQYRPKTWWLVSSNIWWDYAIIDGRGFHTKVADLFVYDPTGKPLTKYGETKPDKGLPEHIFVYDEKKIFKVNESNSIIDILKPQYEQREKENAELEKWVIQFMKAHSEYADIFFDNEELRIYHIHIPLEKEEKFKAIWEGVKQEE